MFSEYIKIAIKHILDTCDGGKQRCCGSCDPSCNDLTRFICFGHNISEINEWIKNNPDLLDYEYEKWFNEIPDPEPSEFDKLVDHIEDFPFD